MILRFKRNSIEMRYFGSFGQVALEPVRSCFIRRPFKLNCCHHPGIFMMFLSLFLGTNMLGQADLHSSYLQVWKGLNFYIKLADILKPWYDGLITGPLKFNNECQIQPWLLFIKRFKNYILAKGGRSDVNLLFSCDNILENWLHLRPR